MKVRMVRKELGGVACGWRKQSERENSEQI
jgi:hypothetical protein